MPRHPQGVVNCASAQVAKGLCICHRLAAATVGSHYLRAGIFKRTIDSCPKGHPCPTTCWGGTGSTRRIWGHRKTRPPEVLQEAACFISAVRRGHCSDQVNGRAYKRKREFQTSGLRVRYLLSSSHSWIRISVPYWSVMHLGWSFFSEI